MHNQKSMPLSAKAIFLKVIELSDENQRQQSLQEQCGGNAELLRKVEGLLAAAGVKSMASPLDAMADAMGVEKTVLTSDLEPSPDATTKPLPAKFDRQQIGPYKLLEQIGQGGFGTVYMAEQTSPVKRKVALKVLKPGMDSNEVIARFEAERQALAMMDHPNIARVLNGGTTEQGRPYFVMELVRGVPVTEYCDEVRATTEERMALFVDICRAVQHAHQKGIIHRDLKPSNILVTMHDDKPVPKVIDFGIAKALSQQLTDRTLFTGYQQMLGTPAYMSPEQAQMSGIDIDTRSDVYSLGVLLYELLTGTTPFDKSSLAKISIDDLRKMIREQDPPRPSARITTMEAMLRSTMADRRRIDERRISEQLRGELDWIVMKSLEKDRNRRYESASALAADVQRFLNNEQVQACPPTVWYQLRKFSRKNRVLLTTTAICLIMLIVASGISVAYAIQAQAAKNDADQQRKDAIAAREQSDRRLKQSRVDFDRALKSLDTIVQEVSSPEFAQLPGVSRVRDDILNKAMSFYEEIISEHDNDPYARMKQALAHHHIAQIHEGRLDAEAVLKSADQSIQVLETLIAEYPDELLFQHSLTLPLFTRMHWQRTSAKRLVDAERCLEITERCTSAGVVDDPEQLALLYYKVAESLPVDSRRARELVEKTIAICESRGLDPVPGTQYWLAERARERHDLFAAVKWHLRGIELFEKLGSDMSSRHRHVDRWLSTVCTARLAEVYIELKQETEAEATMRLAFDRARELHREYSSDARVRQSLVDRAMELGYFLRSKSRGAEAREILKSTSEELKVSDSGNAASLRALARLQQELYGPVEALQSFEKAVESDPSSAEALIELGAHLMYHMPASSDHDEQALEALKTAAEREPTNLRALNLLAELYVTRLRDDAKAEMIVTQILQRHPDDSAGLINRSRIHAFRRDLTHALADMNRVIELEPTVWTYTYRGTLHYDNGSDDLAIADLNRAEQLSPGNHERTVIHYRRALASFRLGDYEKVVEDLTAWSEIASPHVGNGLTVLTAIPAESLRACNDSKFREGMRGLADRLVEKNHQSAAALKARADLLRNLGE
ncbi:MAG: protein kinase [Planctomycetaceae bacterium]